MPLKKILIFLHNGINAVANQKKRFIIENKVFTKSVSVKQIEKISLN